jgi:AcrR family transcriptional regulator
MQRLPRTDLGRGVRKPLRPNILVGKQIHIEARRSTALYSVNSAPKLSSEERRASILQAVRRVFAEKGFDGTTTRELADSAGVSEALLFKHFPNKAALFIAVQLSCGTEQENARFAQLQALEPSASTLVLMVHFLVSRILGTSAPGGEDLVIQNRLMLRSLAEDGEFARPFLRGLASGWIPKVEECFKAAVAAGDAVEGLVRPALLGWFAHDLATMIMIHLLPAKPAVDYGMPREKLAEQAVCFILRGMGLTDDAIKRHYNPRALALLAT